MNRITKQDLINLGYTITSETEKSYGHYFTGIKKYKEYRKIEIIVSNVRDGKYSYLTIRESHYSGHIRGYIKDVAELETILNFIEREKDN